MQRLCSIRGLEEYRNRILAREEKEKTRVYVCMTGCRAYGAAEVFAAVQEEIEKQDLSGQVEIRPTGCHGFCAKAPVLAIDPLGIQYQEVAPQDAADIVALTIKENHLLDRLAYRDLRSGKPIFHRDQIPFYQKQVRRVLANCGRIDPTRIEQYIAAGGYQALLKTLTSMSPEQVVEEVTSSKLRGRGGAGFSTGVKWRFARRAAGRPKYIICNADEGDPGAFMDRAVLEGDPHAVLEGMLIGAYAMGAEYGYIYVREEYPIAVEHLRIAIGQMEELGLLGENILGTGFHFELSLKMGAGAFVCGEETALMASIEGRRGMPRARPPFPAEAGLDAKPTNINNVETWANIPLIIRNGVDWYGRMGTETSKGTKIFSLAGKVVNTGLVEVPIGATIKEVVFDIGGGIPKGRKFKAVQMGGPSGGCVPAQYLNLPIDYDTLQSIGSIMGSGGMVVMDESNCMVEIARFFLAFTQSESCGKCFPCRLGTTQLLEILTRITQGQGRIEDIEIIRDLGESIMKCSLCGLGQTAPKPVLSTLRYFLNEYEQHILDHRCAGAICESMVISPCQHSCPAGVDVPNYVAAVANGRYEDAVEIIRERNPFPAVCGRICLHPCETNCRRGELDEPVAIRALKRYAADWCMKHADKRSEPFSVTRKQKVAVVGAGPAGLTCGYFLAKMGYRATIFEAQRVGGGMLGLTVPEFRLPREVIDAEIGYIQSCGVDIRYDSPVDANHTITDLLKEDYGAVFIATGATSSKRIGILGEEEGLEGLYYGLEFLSDVKSGAEVPLKGRVVVIGGGNVAIDVARTAFRLGAGDVQVFCRKPRDEMRAREEEVLEAEEEGIVIHPSWAPRRIFSEDGRITGIEFVGSVSVMNREGVTQNGFDEKESCMLEAGAVIISVGQVPDISFLSKDSQIEMALWRGSLRVDENTLSSNVPGVFAGGDFVTGPTSLIRAIASGRRAALAIDRFFRGEKGRLKIVDEKSPLQVSHEPALEEETSEGKPRARLMVEGAGERSRDFREVEMGFSEEEACYEAKRCLRCDLERARNGSPEPLNPEPLCKEMGL